MCALPNFVSVARDVALLLEQDGLQVCSALWAPEALPSVAANKQPRRGRGQVGPPEFVALEAEFGIYHTPEKFLEKALLTVHLFDSLVCLDHSNLRSMAGVVERGIEYTKQLRSNALEYYRK